MKKNSSTIKTGAQSTTKKRSATSQKHKKATPKDFIESLENELTRVLKPLDMKLTKQEISSMGKDIMLLIPHLYMLHRLVSRTQENVFIFFEKYGQDRIIKAGNAANTVKRKGSADQRGQATSRARAC